MKKTVFLLISIVWCTGLFSQNITGKWFGELEVRGNKVPLTIHIQKSENGYISTMDSPKQNAYGIPMYKTSFSSGNLFIISNQGFSYRAFLHDGEFTGKFKQNGLEYPLIFTRYEIVEEIEEPIEPEKPQETRDFISENVFFENKKAGITLAGTLTMPLEGTNFPAVILISGSGPQNRDEEIFGHKPFLVMSDYFTRKGIAVLRYDDRGVGESEGKFSSATSADFASDAQAAVNYLLTREEIDEYEIGLLGHSEGGMIAPMIASKSDDVAFLVLLAAPGIPNDELLVLQNLSLAKASGMDESLLDSLKIQKERLFEIIVNSPEDSLKSKLKAHLKKYYPNLSSAQLENEIKKINPWMRYFVKYDPRPALEKTKVPVLALNGEKDLQVTAEENLNGIKTALKKGGNENVTIKMMPGLNHLFQKCETCLPSEYAKLEKPFSSEVMKIITEWIIGQSH